MTSIISQTTAVTTSPRLPSVALVLCSRKSAMVSPSRPLLSDPSCEWTSPSTVAETCLWRFTKSAKAEPLPLFMTAQLHPPSRQVPFRSLLPWISASRFLDAPTLDGMARLNSALYGHRLRHCRGYSSIFRSRGVGGSAGQCFSSVLFGSGASFLLGAGPARSSSRC